MLQQGGADAPAEEYGAPTSPQRATERVQLASPQPQEPPRVHQPGQRGRARGSCSWVPALVLMAVVGIMALMTYRVGDDLEETRALLEEIRGTVAHLKVDRVGATREGYEDGMRDAETVCVQKLQTLHEKYKYSGQNMLPRA